MQHILKNQKSKQNKYKFNENYTRNQTEKSFFLFFAG